jgi:4-diphosphocytidyl-2-C-methyl-D-erythritol kinase
MIQESNIIAMPNAKINLGLNISSKRKDGYHNIETVFYPLNLTDKICISILSDDSDFQFSLTGMELDSKPGDNLVEKAYRLLKEDFKLAPVKIELFKTIPVGAGLGGGSSDAAFTLKLLNDLFRIGLTNTKLELYASRIGADCAFFIRNKPVFATGIGNIFTEVDLNLAGYSWVLVKPDIHVSTAQAYANVVPAKPAVSLTEIIRKPLSSWKDYMKNDFEPSVFRQFPQIATIKQKLYEDGAIYASMSGSGSSVFGIFEKLPKNATMFDNSSVFVGNF